MVLIETANCQGKIEAEQKEWEFIQSHSATLNCQKPHRTKEELQQYKKEWANKNSEKMKQHQNRWWEEHKEIVNEKKKEKIACDCGSEVRKSELSRHYKTKKHQTYLLTH